MTAPASIHATCLLVGARGVLIRGPSGSGKSRLALALLDHEHARGRFAALVADDRVLLSRHHGRVVARPPDGLAGLVERRGLGIEAIAHEAAAVLALVVDIVPPCTVPRLPEDGDRSILVEGVVLARLAVPGDPGLACPLVLAAIGAIGAMGPAAEV